MPACIALVPRLSRRFASLRGFVAHVHRIRPTAKQSSESSGRSAPPPETHVFSYRGDLVNFFRVALVKDYSQR
jgi:hypothetical protein